LDTYVTHSPYFEKNLKRWALLNPNEADAIASLEHFTTFIVQTLSGQLTLTKEKDGKRFSLYSDDPLKEASEWFSSLDLTNVNILYVYGVGLGYYYEPAKEWLKNPQHFLIFVEDDLEVIYRLLNSEQGEKLLQNKQVRIQWFPKDTDTDELWSHLAELFSQNEYRLSALHSYAKEFPDMLLVINAKLGFWNNIHQAIHYEYSNYGQHFYINYYQNLSKLPSSYLASGLYNQFKGIPAIICGAGPSLDKNIALVKQLSNKAVIFAGGTAMNAINSIGLLPQFGLAIDPNEEQNTRLIMNTAFEVPYLYRGRVCPSVLDNIHGAITYVTGSGSMTGPDWFEKKLGITAPKVEEGFNVINFSTALACEMGCNPIILVGVDLAYSNKKSYQSGVTRHPLHHRKNFISKGIHEELLVKNDIYGQPVHTLWKWVSESVWYTRFAQAHPNVLFINATEGGIGMMEIPNKPLQEVADHFLQREIDLNVFAHGELQNCLMPPSVNQENINEIAKEMIGSLTRCQDYYQILYDVTIAIAQDPSKSTSESVQIFTSKIQQEDGYQAILKDFEEFLHDSNKLELEQIDYDADLTEGERLTRKVLVEAQCYRDLQEIAAAHEAMIRMLVLKMPILEFMAEAASGTPVQSSALQGASLKEVDPLNEAPGRAVQIEYPNGSKKMEYFYLDNQLHGPCVFYGEDGAILAQSFYVHGLQQGLATFFYSSGQLFSEQQYVDGVWDGEQRYYYKSGQLKTVMEYLRGLLQGPVTLYYPDGKKKRELGYQQGMRHGWERSWDIAGRLILEVQYLNGKPIGAARSWHVNGQMAQEVLYNEESHIVHSYHWTAEGQLIPESLAVEEDYFDAVTRNTGTLTESLTNVCEQLNIITPLLTDEKLLHKDLTDLHDAIEHLQKINEELVFESGIQNPNTEESIWKTPSMQREMQNKMKEITEKLQRDLDHMQDIIGKNDDEKM